MEITTTCSNGTDAGTTTAAYVAASTIKDTKGLIVNINNLSATATMYYKIDGYRSSSPKCVAEVIKAETGLGSATVAQETVTSPFAKVVISVKYNSGADLYQNDWISW